MGRSSAQTETSIVPVANPPLGIAINASQNAIYVTTGDNTLTLIDGSTNLATVISDPAAANTSGASALLTYQNGVFVLNKNSNNISLYFALDSGQMQPSPLQQLISEPNTKQPTAIVLDPINFGRIFVANAGSDSVSIFDNTEGNGYQLTASLTGIINPQAMVMNTNTHQVFVTSGTNNTVTVIDGTQNAIRSTIQLGFAPKSLAFNTATNQVYVAGPGAQSIADIDASSLATSTISIPNGIPTAIAVNPATNQVFVANLTGVVTLIDASSNIVQGSANVPVGSGPNGQAAIVVDATTNIAYVVIQGGGLSSVNGFTRAVTSVSTGANGSAVLAVNPITHKSYIDSGSSTVVVVDDATNVPGNVAPSQVQPWAVAVNPATNKIYVANFGSNNVSVIDGGTNTVITEVATDSNPNAIAVDPSRNLIFVTNFNSSSATVIDGNTNQGTSVNLSNANPDSIAVNPVFGRVYGASSTQNVIFGFESNSTGSNLNFYTSFSTGPIAVAVNPATGQNYELDSSGTLEAADGPVPSRGITFVCSGGTPKAMDVNPVTNTVYVACSTGNLDVVQNPSGFSNATVNTFSNTGSVNPVGVAVNPLTNQVFIANAGTGNNDASLTIFDVASGNSTVLGLANTPVALAINVASNKIYVQGQTSATTSNIFVIDGASQLSIASIPGFTAGTLTNQVAVNPTTGAVFAVNRSNGNLPGSVSTGLENVTEFDKITTTITPFTGNTTTSVTPTFTFNVIDTLDGATAYTVYYQVDSQQKFWGFAGNTSGQTFSGTVQQPLTPGFHTVYAFAVTGGETAGASSNNSVGFQSNQIVGSLGSYSFLVNPPIANGTFFTPFNFGSQSSGTPSAAQQILLANEGGAPMNFTVAITGPNAADFQQVLYTGTDTLCNTLSGSLPNGTYCAVNVAFQPSTTGPETATLTFTDNSLSVAGSTQSVTLTGTGTAAAQEPLTVTFTGSGKVTDNLSQLNCTASPCTQNYPVNQVVILTATPNTGFTFTGWTGACSGLGTCTVTMSQAQSVSATFVANGAGTCGANDSVWVGGASGNWSLPTNWSTGVVPNNFVNVCINNHHSPASAVTLDISVSIGNLTINAGNTLTIGNNLELVVAGNIANSGQITVFSNNANTFLTISGNVALTGGGTLTMNQVISNGQPIIRSGQPIVQNQNHGILTNVNNLIQGAGQLGNNGLVVNNLSVINANATFALGLAAGSLTNTGVLEATGAGTLQTSELVVNKGGTVTATGSSATVQLFNGTTIQGGTVGATAGGLVNSAGGNSITLDGSSQGAVTISGTYTIGNNSESIVSGTINNTGAIQIPANNANTFLTFSGPVTLTGAGVVTMNQVIANGQPILRNVNNGTLTNVNNLIQGAGQIGNNGLLITNQAAGVIDANGTFPLGLNGATTNQGLLEATAGSTLQISVGVVNTGSNILSTGTNSTIQLFNGTTITGGTLKTALGGLLTSATGNSISLDGHTSGALTLVGTYTIGNNSETMVSGTINNTGTIQIPANNANTFLTFSGPVTLTGAGVVTMNQVISNGQPILRNVNNGTLTNVNNLIQGAGQIGNNGLLITNQAAGVIDANGTFPLGLNDATTNLGLIEATGGSTLQISIVVLNVGANILSTGTNSAIQLSNGAAIQGGTLGTTAGALITSVPGNSIALDGSSHGALNLVGTYTIGNNSETMVSGTINNTGTIQIPANNANTFLTFSGPVTLTGAGVVTMNQVIANGQPILRNVNNGTLTNVNNLIQGAGQIGNNGLLITNQAAGVIDANGTFPLGLNGATTNLGLIEATGGSTLQISIVVLNVGANILSTGTNSAIQLSNGAVIQGGTLRSAAGGLIGTIAGNSIALDGSSHGALTLGGTYTIANNSETVVFGTINNTGAILVPSNNANTFLTFSGPVTLTGGGSVTMTQAISNGQAILRNVNNGTLTNVNNLIQGAGQIGNNGLIVTNQSAGIISGNASFSLNLDSSPITNQGLVIANGAPTPGILFASNYTQTSTGGLEVAIGGTTLSSQYSQLQNAGTATLAGALDISYINGFQPALGQQFTIVTSGAITGTFASINSPSLPSGLAWNLTYTSTTVVLSVISSSGSGSATLTVSDLGTGTGTVTDDLGLINCTTTAGVISGTCSANYASNSVVVLTATPASGTTFTGWNTCTGNGTCAVTLNGNQSVNATFVPTGSNFSIALNTIGTGNGTVTDNVGQINCTTTAGVQSGTCSGTYPGGSVVTLTATPAGTSTFAGFGNACVGVSPCTVNVSGPEIVSASFAPPPQLITLSFPAGSTVSEMATYDCPSNPAPSPSAPCLDPNAHSLALSVPTVLTPFTVTVQATEVPPSVADGICPNGATPTTDFDCRFVSFFTYQTNTNGDKVVPLCYPYANGNCVHYLVFSGQPGTEPPTSSYIGPIDWTISWNNDHFTPPAPYLGSTPRVYDDPDYAVSNTAPFGTDCSTPMLVGNPPAATNPPIFCQFEFDITTFFNPTKPVDATIGARTKQFNDVVVAFPPANAGLVTVTNTPDAATVTAGNPIGFTVAIANNSGGTASNATLSDPLPAGTGVNWSINPAYSGPGTCVINGNTGAQELDCNFGNVPVDTSFSLHLLSPTSSPGTFTNAASVSVTNQQVLSIGTITVTPSTVVTAVFTGLTPSQSITAGTSSITLGGTVIGGNLFPPSGETVSITINGLTQPASIGSNGTFSAVFPTANLPAAATPYVITYSYPGDANFSPASDSSTALTVNPFSQLNFTLNVTEIGTGNGTVTDNLGEINCTTTAGISSGTCSAIYPSGTVVAITATPVSPSTFAGYSGACTGTGACSISMTANQALTASFAPAPQMITLSYAPGTTVQNMATFDCPSNPNPSPSAPCLDPNAHSLALAVPNVLAPFTLTVQATEVPPSVADGICPNGGNPNTDFDCRFATFFTYQVLANGDKVVPLCYPYANGNCVHYLVFSGAPGTEPPTSAYIGPIDWTISWNNDHFTPPAPYLGSTPRVYDDPDYAVSPTAPFGTNCSTPMQVGNPPAATNPPIFCQFEFDITTFFNPTKPVDATIGARTKQFNDVVVAFPPFNAGLVTVTNTPDAATVVAGNPIGFTVGIANTSGGTAVNATLSDPLPAGAGVNWSISPAYSGPGTCLISGAIGAQELDCTFGNIAVSTSFTIHLLSATSSAGTYTNAVSVTVTNQQVLSIGTITVTAPATGLAQTITFTVPETMAPYNTAIPYTVSASSGLSVTIAAAGSCAFGGGAISITSGTGVCTLTASQAGNAQYAPAPNVVRTITAEKAATATTITANTPNPSTTAQSVATSFKVTGARPSGIVTVNASTGESCTSAIASGLGSCSITFRTAGVRTLVASYPGDGNYSSSASTAVSQTVNPVTPPQLKISPTSVNFGQVLLGFAAAKTVTLSNPGTVPVAISKVAMAKTGTGEFGAFGVLNLCPASLAVGKSCLLAVGYVPLHDNPTGALSTASIVITDNVPGSPQSVPLTAQTINPRASLSATQLTFSPAQKVGTTSPTQILTLKNSGSSPLVLGAISVTTTDYAIAAKGTTCAAGTSLAPTKSCTIAVAFTPKSKGARIAALEIKDNALLSPLLIRLTGQAN